MCPLHSFGKQLGGRRGCECITLEPSEMIVVSRDPSSLYLCLSPPKHFPFMLSPLSSPCFDIIPAFPFLFDVGITPPTVLVACSPLFSLLSLLLYRPRLCSSVCAPVPYSVRTFLSLNSNSNEPQQQDVNFTSMGRCFLCKLHFKSSSCVAFKG